MIVKFKASNFQGNCYVDEDFVPHLVKMNYIAKKHNLIVVVTSSHRKTTKVDGAIVKPAKMSNHLIGHAIDCNLQSINTKEYFNSTKMGDGKGPDEAFIQEVINTTKLRWGGKFTEKDEVHFDDKLNIEFPDLYKAKYDKLYK